MNKAFIYKQIGKNIARIRKEKGYTQESFAELMNRSWSCVAKIETGSQNISIGKLLEIASYLKVDFTDFLKFTQNQP